MSLICLEMIFQVHWHQLLEVKIQLIEGVSTLGITMKLFNTIITTYYYLFILS